MSIPEFFWLTEHSSSMDVFVCGISSSRSWSRNTLQKKKNRSAFMVDRHPRNYRWRHVSALNKSIPMCSTRDYLPETRRFLGKRITEITAIIVDCNRKFTKLGRGRRPFLYWARITPHLQWLIVYEKWMIYTSFYFFLPMLFILIICI